MSALAAPLIDRPKQLGALLRDVILNSDFYGNFYEDAGIRVDDCFLNYFEERFDDLPLLETRHLLELADGFPVNLNECFRITCSGGTTGRPKILYRTMADWAQSGENMREVFQTTGMTAGDALLIAQPFGLWGVGYLAIEGCRNLKCLAIPFGNNDDWLKLAYLLDRFNVKNVFGSPSFLHEFTTWAETNNVSRRLRLLLAGEKLSTEQRDYLSSYWQMGVYNLYGSEETDALGAECPAHDGMHILEHSFIYQLFKDGWYVDQTLPGEYEGELVITSLYHRGTPLIKYRLGDIVRIDRSERLCRCGNPNPRLSFIAKARECVMLYDATKLYLYQIDQALDDVLHRSVDYQVIVEDLEAGSCRERVTLLLPAKGLTDADARRIEKSVRHSSPDLADSLRREQLDFRVARGARYTDKTDKGKWRQIIDRRKEPKA